MPIPLKQVATLAVVPWYLEKSVWIDTITDEDFGAFHRDELPPYYRTSVDIRTTCVYVSLEEIGDFPAFAKTLATQVEFVLNNFSTNAAIAIPYAVLMEVGDRSRVVEIADVEPIVNIEALKGQEHEFREAVDAAAVSSFYGIVRSCCDSDDSLVFALDRFNSALIRSVHFDRIVDIAISLESLIPGTGELRFRFALNNSFVAASEPGARLDAFGLLTALYDARSAIVHGDVQPKPAQSAIATVQENWRDLVRLTRAALNYYILFRHEHSRVDWEVHIRNLVFGIDKRFVD